jgi:hypothetical protein
VNLRGVFELRRSQSPFFNGLPTLRLRDLSDKVRFRDLKFIIPGPLAGLNLTGEKTANCDGRPGSIGRAKKKLKIDIFLFAF